MTTIVNLKPLVIFEGCMGGRIIKISFKKDLNLTKVSKLEISKNILIIHNSSEKFSCILKEKVRRVITEKSIFYYDNTNFSIFIYDEVFLQDDLKFILESIESIGLLRLTTTICGITNE